MRKKEQFQLFAALSSMLLVLAVVLGAALQLGSLPQAGPALAPTGATTPVVFLPFVSRGVSGNATPTPTPTGGGGTGSGALFLNRSAQTNSISVAVDAAGGIHVAYAGYGAYASGRIPAYYAYCPANCSSLSSYTTIMLSDRITKVQLELTPAGKPRIMLFGDDANFNKQYSYAACDTTCTNLANWTVTPVALSKYIDINTFYYSMHSFALNAQGLPRLIYYDDDGWGGHRGLFYAFCNSGCTNAANWSEINLDNSTEGNIYDQPSLVLTSGNQPRLLVTVFRNSPNFSGLYYIECNSNCETTPTNWTLTPLLDRGYGQVAWVLRLTSTGQPRVAFYQGELDNSDDGEHLNYVWCNTTCSNNANWYIYPIGLASGEGQDPDLRLDSQNRPRIAYRSDNPDGLGYAWCTSNCEAGNAGWQHILAEDSRVMDNDFPVPPPANCTTSYWYGGYRPSLALDSSGNPRIGYDAQSLYGGNGCTVGSNYHAVRFVFFPKP